MDREELYKRHLYYIQERYGGAISKEEQAIKEWRHKLWRFGMHERANCIFLGDKKYKGMDSKWVGKTYEQCMDKRLWLCHNYYYSDKIKKKSKPKVKDFI